MDSETRYHIEDVGRILLDAQDSLRDIRRDLQQRATSPAMARRLEDLFDEAESNIRSKAQNVLNSVMRSQVSVLPHIHPSNNGSTSGNTSNSNVNGPAGANAKRVPTNRKYQPSRKQKVPHALSKRATRKLLNKYGMMQEDPAAQHAKIDRRLAKAELNKLRLQNSDLVRRKTALPQEPLPALNRIDAAAPAPVVSERDIQAGLYNMVSRGFVPRGTDLGPAFQYGPAPLQSSAVRIANGRPAGGRPETSTVGSFNVSALKFDLAPTTIDDSYDDTRHEPTRSINSRPSTSPTSVGSMSRPGTRESAYGSRPGTVGSYTSQQTKKQRRRRPKEDREEEGLVDDFAEAVEEIRGYNELLDEFSLHQFIIRKGATLTDTPEYESFRRKHNNIWGSIKTVIRYLEELLQVYSIPLAYVDGQKVAQLALDELSVPTKELLVDCIANRDEVVPIIEATGQRFKADAGETLAAVLIQSVFRMYGLRKAFVEERSRLHAAESIQEMWRCAMVRTTFLSGLWRKRAAQNKKMQELQDHLVVSWPLIRHKRRVIVHLPSVSYDYEKRCTAYDLRREQNLTISRLCDVKDPTVDVIYVAPFHMSPETIQYWYRVLQVGGIKDPRSRLTIVVPENLDRFPITMSLTKLLLYSPRAMHKIRNLVGTRDAYIVSAGVNNDTEKLALELNIPIMGPRSRDAQLYASCAGATSVFAEAKLMVPHGCRDIYDEQQFLLTLTKLIAAYPLIKRWTFKIEGEFEERGFATIEPRRLAGHAKVVKLYKKMQEESASQWARPEVQQSVQETILSDLEASLIRWIVIMREDLYPHYGDYMSAFCRHGGAIEAQPPNVHGKPSASIFIAPTGEVSLVCSHDNIYHNEFFKTAGCFPQDSVPATAVYGASKAVGRALFKHGIFGFAEIHYVAWFDMERDMPALWATDLQLKFTRNIASFNLFDFMTRGTFDAIEGRYTVDMSDSRPDQSSNTKLAIMNKGKPLRSSSTGGRRQVRTYIYSDTIRLRQISRLHYESFFNLCRLEHISFDLPNLTGTVFQLIDSLSRGIFGMVCISTSSRKSIASMWKNLLFIKDQVSANSGSSNQRKRQVEHSMDNFLDVLSCIRHLRQP